jgi:FtsP/CotA-like multicopper oxidase with cupredoxin domain
MRAAATTMTTTTTVTTATASAASGASATRQGPIDIAALRQAGQHPACRIFLAALAALFIVAGVRAQAPQVFELALANGRLAGAPGTLRVKRGDTVELRWSSDRPISLHLHGYDIEAKVSPRSPAVMSFKAALAGRFPVSEHAGGHERAVLYLEVHP